MSDPTQAGPAADRNLLYGMLALQMNFVTRDALLQAMQAWVFATERPLGELLQERGALTPQQRQALDLLTAEHLKAHGDDAQRSLAAVAVPPTVGDVLHGLPAPDPKASLFAPDGSGVTADLRPPVTPGMRYEVLRPHARGGLGVVSVARDAELGRVVALKEMQAGHSGDPTSRGRFVREAEITGGLEHPGIVPVYGLGRHTDGRPYYAMRLVRGETLQDAIKKLHAGEHGYTLRSLLTRFVAVCNTIAYAHSRGVIHRDLKPANVMLGPYGETLVVDWGLAKVVGRPAEAADGVPPEGMLQPGSSGDGLVSRAGSALGTPGYMSPEQAAGRGDDQGPATDVYGLGSTLYALLTGRAPVPGQDAAAVMEKVRQGDWPAPRQVKSGVPRALDAACRKAMALDPQARYGSALELAADVEHWLDDEPVSAYPEPLPARLRRWGRRHKTAVTAVAALLLTAGVGLGLGLRAVDQERQRTHLLERQTAQVLRLMEASSQEQEGQREQAVQSYRNALALQERLSAEHPSPENRHLLAGTLRNLGKLLHERREDAEAARLQVRAVELNRALRNDFPSTAPYRRSLRDSLAALDETLLAAGEHAAAAVAAADLADAGWDPGADAYDAARYLCRCVQAAEQDPNLPAGERKASARAYADRAVGLLGQAAAEGWTDAARLRADAAFTALRDRADFRRLTAAPGEKSGGKGK
jgi:serine/threonine protein kinase